MATGISDDEVGTGNSAVPTLPDGLEVVSGGIEMSDDFNKALSGATYPRDGQARLRLKQMSPKDIVALITARG